LYTSTVLIFAINSAIQFLSAQHPDQHASGDLTPFALNALLLMYEMTNAMILSGVDLCFEVYHEFLLLRLFFVSSKHHACRYLQLVCFFIRTTVLIAMI
jgi:hypothetical protein